MKIFVRGASEIFRIGDDITIMVVDVTDKQVRLGVEAPTNVPVMREELLRRKHRKNADDSVRTQERQIPVVYKGRS